MVWLWVGFIAFVFVMMVLDLKFVGSKDGSVTVKTALLWTGVCIILALGFLPVVYWIYEHHVLHIGTKLAADGTRESVMKGTKAATLFFQGWLLEYSLSVDNLFVFAVIFRHFAIPPRRQHRVLAWGIIAALILRGVMIGAGAWVFGRFHFMLYIAGAFLIWTAIGMIRSKDEEFNVDKNFAARLAKRVFPLVPSLEGDKFFVRQHGESGSHLAMTPLFLVLVVINVVDVVFALDSIPAIFGVTTDPFLVFTSNVFAILGLRSLYFAIAALMGKFELLKYALAFILAFIGVKMLLEMKWIGIHISSPVSLGVIVCSLTIGVLASIVHARRHGEESPGPDATA